MRLHPHLGELPLEAFKPVLGKIKPQGGGSPISFVGDAIEDVGGYVGDTVGGLVDTAGAFIDDPVKFTAYASSNRWANSKSRCGLLSYS
jgi:hypothetical protein